uniref:Uncharacterized protein n=1 Tax=Kalanchoe fedtschenkoi TaxID=63787 RepID=A0A7N0TDZ4_KALFE
MNGNEMAHSISLSKPPINFIFFLFHYINKILFYIFLKTHSIYFINSNFKIY